MDPVRLVALLVVAVGVGGLARRYGWPGPLLLVGVGLALSVPAFGPHVPLEPEAVLLLVLPPLLYAAALESSVIDLRADARPVVLLSVGLVLATAAAVGLVVLALVPGMPAPVAFALGAVVAPPDAVAATAIGRRLRLPRRMMTILEGESLLNDATALTAYRVAVAAAVGAVVPGWRVAVDFVQAAAGGTAVGLAAGWALTALLHRLRDPLLESTANLVAPFVAYVAGEAAHTSGVLAVVVCGLFVAHRGQHRLSYATRLQSEQVWRVLVFVLESLVFLLIGLQLRPVLADLTGVSVPALVGWSAAVLATVVVVRMAWVLPAALVRVGRPRQRATTVPGAVVVGWAGMRGVVSLAAAFGLPLTTDAGRPLPYRALVVFLTFVVVVGTLVLQGLTLPALIRRTGVAHQPGPSEALAQAAAVDAAVRAGLARLDEAVDDKVPAHVVERLRQRAEVRAQSGWERLGRQETETPAAAYRRLRREMIHAERRALQELRDAGRIEDEVLRAARRELDFEEALLNRP